MRGRKEERPPGSGTWRLRVYTGQRTPNGSPVQQSKTIRGVKGKREADSALAAFVLEVERKHKGRHGATLDDLLTRWMTVQQHTHTAYTAASYRQKLDHRIRPALGKIKLTQLTAAHLDEAYAHWLGEGLSPTTVHQLHAIIAAALARGVKWEWLTESPALKATPPQPNRDQGEGMTVDQFGALIRAAEETDPVLAAAVALAGVTGCRRGELCALRWTDVDLEVGIVSVARSLTVVDRTVTENTTKTKQRRVLTVDPLLLGVFRRRLDDQRVLAAAASVPLAADGFVLSRVARGDQPCLPNGLTHAFGRVARGLGMPWHFHDLRHFSATVAIASGGDVRTVAARLGHADPSMTLRRYSHAVTEQERRIAGVLGAALPAERSAEGL